ncbi:nitrate- and nitrite sensing domain-containing protein [Micromonospora sp. URMC 103]|uniref:nitrate- and nitrite sensing domain-containing protein n=1 Tax=Micromonospora sp. URMC 103 TaxID=3423406 RepID=UPI003F19903E
MNGPETATTGQRLRRLFAATAVVLVALWTYGAYVTGRDAADLLRIGALAETLGQPTDRLILDLQAERRLTAGSIAGGPRARSALVLARNDTDRTVAALRDAAGGTDLRLLTAGAVRDRADVLLRELDGLTGLRAEADAGRAETVDAYDRLVDTAFAVYGPEWGSRESRLAAESRAVVALARSRELLAREDTLVTAALTNGRITADDRRRLTELVGTQRYASAEAVAALPSADQDDHRAMMAGSSFAALQSTEDRLLAGDDRPALGVDGWQAAVEPALDELHELVQSTARHSVERATPGAALLIVRTGLVLGLGLVAVLTLLLTGAGAIRRLADRPDATPAPDPVVPPRRAPEPAAPVSAAMAATNPGFGPGRPVGPGPVTTGWPAGHNRPPATGPGRNEPGAVPVHRDLFLRLTQRNQALLRDQLTLLDAMERRERGPEEAAELFHLDHLATRLRRNVEKLVTLAGARPARRWRRPIPMLDVARGAVAEVPDYQRVLVAPHWPWSLAGPAVTDVIHLLAELIENALVFSSAGTAVRVAGEHRPDGCAVVVIDDGPGLTPAALAAANRLLAEPPTAGPPSGHAGLYAAALLAARCGARVSLRPGPRGGTAAVVLLPTNLVMPTGPAGAAPGPGGTRPSPSARPTAGTGATGDLPVRTRHPGSVWSGPDAAGPATVEMPVSRAARGRS